MKIKDQVKQFWNDRPCNIKHSGKEFLSKEYFDEVEYKKYLVEPHIPGFADFEKWKGKKVLEIGCGIGTDSINFARNGAELTIVEFSDKSLEICKKRFEVFDLKANFYCGDVEKLSEFLPIEEYDLIYSFGVIHHTPNPQKAFEEIYKYMNRDTELRVMLYSKISYKLFWVMMENNIREITDMENLIRKNAEAQYDCPVAYTYTFDEIEDMLLKVGIKVEKIWKDHIFTYDIENYKKNIYVKDRYWKDVDDKLLKQFEKELGWHTMLIGIKN
jgi:2-polyprenyl-3-methyl-5-hydroxy-6-metoxy-1,4-benzoquinol methylase